MNISNTPPIENTQVNENVSSFPTSFITGLALVTLINKIAPSSTFFITGVALNTIVSNFRTDHKFLVISCTYLYSIPEILKCCSASLAKTIISVSLLVTGSLLFRGCALKSYAGLINMGAALTALDGLSLFDSALFVTGILGYMIPFSLHFINKGRELLFNAKWLKSITDLQQGFQQTAYSPSLFNLFERIDVLKILFYPLQGLGSPCTIPFSMNFASRSDLLKAFNNNLDNLKRFTSLRTTRRGDILRSLNVLSNLLSNLDGNDLEDCVDLLLQNEKTLKEGVNRLNLINKSEHFVSIFPANTHSILTKKIQSFSDKWKALDSIQRELYQLNDEVKKINVALKNNDLETLKKFPITDLNKKFKQARQEIYFIHQEEDFWAYKSLNLGLLDWNILGAWNKTLHTTVSLDLSLKISWNEFYELVKVPSNNISRTLELASSKIQAAESTQSQPENAYEHLLSIGFPFPKLQTLLGITAGVTSAYTFELNSLGLKTVEDLTTHNILPKDDLISEQLYSFIEEALKTHIEKHTPSLETYLDMRFKDFWIRQETQEILKVSSKEAALKELEKIGIRTKADLKSHHILPSDDELLIIHTKHQDDTKIDEECLKIVENNLQNYAKTWYETNDFTTKTLNFITINHASNAIQRVGSKIATIIFRLSVAGLILVPVLADPLAASIGFGAGVVYYTLCRFCNDQMQSIYNAISSNIPLQIHYYTQGLFAFISHRNLLTNSPMMQRELELFYEEDFFGKIRLLNMEMLLTAGITNFSLIRSLLSINFSPFFSFPLLPIRDKFLGPLAQGFFLGREVVHIV